MVYQATLHIVHPFTYRVVKDTFILGPIENPAYLERDRKVSDLVKRTLDSRNRVIRHDAFTSPLRQIMERTSLSEGLNELFDERVIGVTTTPSGTPLYGEKPDKVSEENWKKVSQLIISHEKMKELSSGSSQTIFIGGYYYHCLANALGVHLRDFRSPEEEVFTVRELCPVYNGQNQPDNKEIERKLAKYNFKDISFDEALKLVS